jgi:hypothetical protein
MKLMNTKTTRLWRGGHHCDCPCDHHSNHKPGHAIVEAPNKEMPGECDCDKCKKAKKDPQPAACKNKCCSCCKRPADPSAKFQKHLSRYPADRSEGSKRPLEKQPNEEMLLGPPAVMEAVEVLAWNEDTHSLLLHWKKPSDNILSFSVQVRIKEAFGLGQWQPLYVGPELKYALDNLEPGFQVEICLSVSTPVLSYILSHFYFFKLRTAEM